MNELPWEEQIDRKKNEWALIYSNQVMENSQITNVCNDGEDNDLKSIGKGHSSFIHKIHNEMGTKRRVHLKAHIWTLISNWLRKTALNGQYTHLMEKDIIYIRKYMHLFFFSFTYVYFEYQQMSYTENT